MFGFKSGKRVRIRKASTRIINETFNCAATLNNAVAERGECREDSRSKRTLPVYVVAPKGQQLSSGAPGIIGIADDMSCFGIGVLISEPVTEGQVFSVCFSSEGGDVGFKATCVRQSALGLGTYRCGFEFMDVLSAADTSQAMRQMDSVVDASA